MSSAVAYLERAGSGSTLRGVRFVHARGQSVWSAPAAPSPGNVAPVAPTAESVRRATAEAAGWIAAQLKELPGSTDLLVCLDADGARCAWMNTAAGDDKALADTISAARADAVSSPDDPSHTGRSLHWLDTLEPGADSTAQALGVAVAAPPKARGTGGRPFSRRPEAAKPRMAVLASPDLVARLVLDELDARGVEVRQVLSIWHAVALAWEQDGAEAAAADARVTATARRPGTTRGAAPVSGTVTAQPESSIDQSALAPVWVSVLIEPGGRLVWSWSRRGALVAAGSMRLRRSVSAPDAPPEGGPPADVPRLPAGSGVAPAEDGGSENSRPIATSSADDLAIVEIALSDAGRLVAEWLSWSLQLATVPSRLRVVGPPALTCAGFNEDLPGVPAAAALAHHLTSAWPGAMGEPRVRDDPVLDTLRSLVQAHNDLSGAIAGPSPLLGLTSLSARPGRATRSAYLWQGVVAVLVAVLVTGLGVKLRWAAGDQAEAGKLVAEQREANIKSVMRLVPGLRPDHPDPVAIMRQRLTALKGEQVSAPPESPVLPELIRVLSAASTEGEAKANPQLSRIVVESRGVAQAMFQFTDPMVADGFEQRVTQQAVPTDRPYVQWTSRTTPGAGGGPRSLVLTGTWVTPKPARAAPAGNANPPPAGGPGGTP